VSFHFFQEKNVQSLCNTPKVSLSRLVLLTERRDTRHPTINWGSKGGFPPFLKKNNAMPSFRYHGNYVGPGWSAGRYQPSVANSRVPAVDEFDASAKQHDRAYALKHNLKEADYRFYKQNIGKGWKRSAAALAVGVQGFLRKPEFQSSSQKKKQKTEEMPPSPMSRSRSASKRSRSRGSPPRYKKSPSPPRSGAGIFKKRKSRSPTRRTSRRRSRGASDSKSSGFFQAGSSAKSPLDYYAKKGVVTVRETGGILTTTAAEKAQTLVVGHSTFNPAQLQQDMASAMLKMIFNKLGQTIDDFEDSIKISRNLEVEFFYIPFVGGSEQSIMFTMIAGSNKYSQYVDTIATTVFTQQDKNTQLFWQRVVVKEVNIATTPSVPGTVLLRLNLKNCKFQLYAKSALKIQNRTINSAGADEQDDVDNVPLYGKSYEGKGNWLQFGNNSGRYVSTPANQLAANIMTAKYNTDQQTLEPPVKSVVYNCSKTGKAHLDPGQIKTSVLTFSKKYTLNKLLRAITVYNQTTTPPIQHLSIGSYRVFMLEKMIQAVATTDVNAMNVAYEADLKVGVVCTASRQQVSNYIQYLSPK